MSNVIRLSSAGPRFRSGGFELDQSWREFDPAALTERQIETLRKQLGPCIRVYPPDAAALDALLNPPATDDNKPPAPDAQTSESTQAVEADTKAAKAARKKG